MKTFVFLLLNAIFFVFQPVSIIRASEIETSQLLPGQVGKYNLDRVRMNVIETAENGVVNHETIFLFSQKERLVSAYYSGGKISQGYLVGRFLSEDQLTFSYCQMQTDGTIDNGVSVCDVSISENGKITLTEHFEWKSRPGEFGTNVFQEF